MNLKKVKDTSFEEVRSYINKGYELFGLFYIIILIDSSHYVDDKDKWWNEIKPLLNESVLETEIDLKADAVCSDQLDDFEYVVNKERKEEEQK